jgi:WS/DGAT/MGAT family acyltransferase
MPSADAAWLHMDRPTNLMVINSVLLFDQPVDWERVKQITQRRLVNRYPRFRQRVVESRLPLRAPSWETDPDFALEHHLHHIALPRPGDTAALQALVGDLMTMPLDRSRPLWHVHMVDGFGAGAAMIVRMHHCIADGIALAWVMLSLTDAAPETTTSATAEGREGALHRELIGALLYPPSTRLVGALERGIGFVHQGMHLIVSPSHAATLASAIVRDGATVLRLLLTPTDAATALKGDPGISRRVAWSRPLSLALIKRIAHAHDATVNDVVLAAVSGALRHYLRDHGSRVGEIQAMVPFNLRPLDRPVPRDLGNKFGLVLLPLPVGVSGSYRRLVEVHRRMDEIKHSRDGAVSYALLSATSRAPEPLERRVVDLFSAKGTAVMTNVPGPSKPVYLAGTPIRTVLVWAPTSGHIGTSVSIFSYRGEVTVGLMVDAGRIPDPDRIVTELEHELHALGRLGHGGPQRQPRRRTRSRQRRRSPARAE